MNTSPTEILSVPPSYPTTVCHVTLAYPSLPAEEDVPDCDTPEPPSPTVIEILE